MRYRIFFLLFISLIISPGLRANINISEKTSEIYVENKMDYILDRGDTLQISFIGLEIFNGNYAIKPDGFLTLPEIGRIEAKGKTIKELNSLLVKKYSNIIYDPVINITIIKYRPLQITLRGEVNKSGLFTLEYGVEKINQNILSEKKRELSYLIGSSERDLSTSYRVPQLFDLIQLGQGITSYADLQNIQIIRNYPKIKGGGKIKTTVNLISLLRDGDQSVNLDLRDGDDVFIPKSKKILLEQVLQVNKSNLTPDSINVFVNGNVNRKGLITLQQGTSLTEAIAAVGGSRDLSGKIEFVRLKKDGKTEKMIMNYNRSALKGTKSNPILISGDMIFVRKNLFGKASGFIQNYTAPLVNAYGVYKIFD